MPITFPRTGLPDLADDAVTFTVEVDRSRCLPPSGAIGDRLKALETDGFSTRLSRLVAFAGIHYHNAVEDFSRLTMPRAQIKAAWEEVARFRPRVEDDRLVFTKRDNPAVQSTFSEVVGVGAGLLLARHLYDRPYRFWRSLGHSRLDYAATLPAGETVKVELRGRFDRSGWAVAKAQVEGKIVSGSSFNLTAGILFAPRSTSKPRTPDFCVMDPEGDGGPVDPTSTQRDIVAHYAMYFLSRGFLSFGGRLSEISQSPTVEFEDYLRRGDPILRQSTAMRTTFRIGQVQYQGSAWEGVTWPTALVGPENAHEGVFLDGLPAAVVDALRRGAIDDLIAMEVSEESVRQVNNVYLTLDDGRGLVWLPSMSDLLEHQ